MDEERSFSSFSIAQLYRALSDRTRLRLLNLLDGQELSVCCCAEVLDRPQPTISRHLRLLRKAGLVATRPKGTWVHYRAVVPPHAGAARILMETLVWMKDDSTMQADRARLSASSWSLPRYEAMQCAPLPPPILTTRRISDLGSTANLESPLPYPAI